ncbi:MAG: DegV family protein [Clostridiales bacterium]|nr:DegV family protein [Clostridiales bacterium]
MAIKLTADRMIDLPKTELQNMGVSTISCYINMAGQSFSDLDDVFPEDVFRQFERRRELAKTAAKSPEQYCEFFEQFTKNGDTVIHFAASGGISAICSNAQIAAQKLGRVFVVDTLTLSNGIALLVSFAAALIANGETDAEKIYVQCLAKREKVKAMFIIETLDYLYKGGRCSGMQLFGANLLKIRPVIAMDSDGKMRIREKLRGNYRRAIAKYIENTFQKYPDADPSLLYIMHFCDDETTNSFLLAEVAKHRQFERVLFNPGSCNCAVHSGRNTVGLFFCVK